MIVIDIVPFLPSGFRYYYFYAIGLRKHLAAVAAEYRIEEFYGAVKADHLF